MAINFRQDRQHNVSVDGGRYRMKALPLLAKLSSALGLFLILAILYGLLIRPSQLHWGATAEEVSRAMPGDDLVPHPAFLATRAITINGPPEEIWAWLVQRARARVAEARSRRGSGVVLALAEFAFSILLLFRLRQWLRVWLVALGAALLLSFVLYSYAPFWIGAALSGLPFVCMVRLFGKRFGPGQAV